MGGSIGDSDEQITVSWSCSCGGSGEAVRVQVVSRTKNTLLAYYLCQLCGRRELVTIPAKTKALAKRVMPIGITDKAISCDDVLDIKLELARTSLSQIKSLAKRKHQS